MSVVCGEVKDFHVTLWRFYKTDYKSTEMNGISQIDELCRQLPYCEVDAPFGPEVVTYRLSRRIFALLWLEHDPGMMTPQEKNSISHRTRAVEQLRTYLTKHSL